MKIKYVLLGSSLLLIGNVFGQSSNIKDAGRCYGIIMASVNANLIQLKDVSDQDFAAMHKYGPTAERIYKKISECKGKANNVQSLKVCEEKVLGNKNDIDFLSGLDQGVGFIAAKQTNQRKDLTLFKINEFCHGIK
jgi:hypothetical protein